METYRISVDGQVVWEGEAEDEVDAVKRARKEGVDIPSEQTSDPKRVQIGRVIQPQRPFPPAVNPPTKI